jgi:hypothetical protein
MRKRNGTTKCDNGASTSFISRLMRTRVIAAAMSAVAMVSLTVVAAPPAQATTQCSNAMVGTYGKYWLNNNLWGAYSGTGWQCTWDSYVSGDTVGWGTSWSWSGNPNGVKSYASENLGWRWDNGWGNTGLPARIWDNKNVYTGWNFSVSGNNTLDVAYDLWFKWDPNGGNTDELMVWAYHSGGAGPVGSKQTSVYIGGAWWDLYMGNIGWNVYSFVRQDNSTNVNLNLRDFINDVTFRGWMSNSKYLTSVEAGTEVFTGTGGLNVNSYYATVG